MPNVWEPPMRNGCEVGHCALDKLVLATPDLASTSKPSTWIVSIDCGPAGIAFIRANNSQCGFIFSGLLGIFERDGRLFYKFKVLRNSRLRQSILQDKISEIGKIKPVVREVNLNADRKRFWLGNLSAINHESNDSMPISLNHFTKTYS